MFEIILWAKAVEKTVGGADKISLASVEAVLKNLDRLAFVGTWSIGIILFIAAIAVGYNIYSAWQPLRRLRKEFQKEIKRARKELEDHISILHYILAADIEKTRAGVMTAEKKFHFAASLWSNAIKIYITARSIASEEVKEKIDVFIQEVFLVLDSVLTVCKKKNQQPDIEKIEQNISKTPSKLVGKKTHIEKMLEYWKKKR